MCEAFELVQFKFLPPPDICCPFCGGYKREILEAHPWQKVEVDDESNTFRIVAEGEELKCKCIECGGMYWMPGSIYIHRKIYE